MSFQRIWKVGLCLPLLSVGVFHPRVARAESPARQANELQTYLQAALRLYESLDYEQALEKLARAKGYVRDLEDDALLSFHEGIILSELNRWEQAKAAFRAGLLLKPEARLPLKVSPKVEKEFEVVRAEVQRELAAQQARQGPEARRPSLEPTVSTPGLTATSMSRPRVLSYALMGGGVAMTGAGVYLGLSSLSFNARKREMTIDEAVGARATAGTQLTVGSVLLGAGLAALGTGTVLLHLSEGGTGTAATDSKTLLVLVPQPGGIALGSAGSF